MSFLNRLKYWRRILDAYVLRRGNSNLSFWHTKLEANRLNESDLVSVHRYPMNFTAKTKCRTVTDSQGTVMLDYKGSLGLQYNPNAIAQIALGFYDLYLDTQERGDKTSESDNQKSMLTQANWFLTHGRHCDKNIRLWEYEFNFECRETLTSPWRSALAQGQAVSVLIRAFNLTGHAPYADAAHQGFNAFRYDCHDESCGVVCRDEEGVWLEEFILSKPNHVLNGFIWALWGVRDYAVWTQDDYAVSLYQESESTLARNLSIYDLGFWTCYDDTRKVGGPIMPASPYYHNLHMVQVEAMYRLTGKDVYRATLDRWSAYNSKPHYKWAAFAWKCWFKVRHW